MDQVLLVDVYLVNWVVVNRQETFSVVIIILWVIVDELYKRKYALKVKETFKRFTKVYSGDPFTG